jgi:Tol biopolymer transport system component
VASAVLLVACTAPARSPTAAPSTTSAPSGPSRTEAPGSGSATATPPNPWPCPAQQPAPNGQDAWTRTRAGLPADVPVYEPVGLPARFGAAVFDGACVDDLGPRYAVEYHAGDEVLVFILGAGMGAWGNFPGPPTSHETVNVRGVSGTVMVTSGAIANGIRQLTSLKLSWREGPLVYAVVANSAQLSGDDLRKIADALVPVPPAARSSADLGAVAYVQDGDLWAQSLPDGTPLQLTHDGHAANPRWSPSGQWLLADDTAATSPPRETVVRADGGAMRSVSGCVAWSPVADQLACVQPGAGYVLESTDGTQRRAIRLDPSPEGAAWNPDGTRIAYTVDGPLDRSQTPYSRSSSLWILDVASGTAQRVFANDGYAPTGGQVQVLGWSADGTQVRYFLDPQFAADIVDGLSLYSIPADGGTPRRVSAGLLVARSLLGGFDATGRQLVTDGSGRETWSHKRVAVLAPDGALTDLTPASDAAFGPAWSPSGAQVAYTSAPDIGRVPGGPKVQAAMAQRRIWVMAADGSGARQLTPDGPYRDERPLWSADGSWILFARIDAAGRAASLWLVPSGGGTPQHVADVSSGGPTPIASGYLDLSAGTSTSHGAERGREPSLPRLEVDGVIREARS